MIKKGYNSIKPVFFVRETKLSGEIKMWSFREKRIWAVNQVRVNWRIRKRLPRLTALGRKLLIIQDSY